jgi:hypothetical protein
MIKQFLKKLGLGASIATALLGFASPVLVYAAPGDPADTAAEAVKNVTDRSDNKDAVCEGVGLTGGGDCGGADAQVGNVIKRVINILSMVVGIVAVVMIIIGGFKYVTSMGDSNSVNSAKNTILYAIVGLVIVVMAQVIVRFVLTKATAPPTSPTSDAIDAVKDAANKANTSP